MDHKPRTAVLFLVFVVLGIYYPAIFSPLNSVDDPGMYEYLLNTDHFSFRSIFFSGGDGNYYRPILVVSYLMDKYVWGLEESFMHLENVVFHLLNTLLVFAIARKVALLQDVRNALVPLTAALFFALHPVNTEVVNWIAGRTDLLAGFFLFLSFYLLLTRSKGALITLSSAFSMLVACLAKETAIFFLPAALLLPFFFPEKESRPPLLQLLRPNLLHFTAFLTAGGGYFLFRFFGFDHRDQGVVTVISHVAGEQSAGLWHNLRVSFQASGFYLKKLVAPFPLNFGITTVSELYIPLGMLLLVVLLWLLTRRTLTAYLFLCAALVGSSSLILPLIKQTWTPLAERYLYIPSAFFLMGLTLTLYRSQARRRFPALAPALVCLTAVIAGYGTAARNLLWQDNLALFEDTARKSPDFVPAKNEMATALHARGRHAEANELILSLQVGKEQMSPQYALVSKSTASLNKGDYAAAKGYLEEALKNPGKHEILILQRLSKLHDQQVMEGTADMLHSYPERLRLLSRLYELTGDPFQQYRLGQLHMQGRQPKLAQAAFALAAVQAPRGAYYQKPAADLSERLAQQIETKEQ